MQSVDGDTTSSSTPSPVLPATTPRVAVVGAGAAGATCARHLAASGVAVTVFDKSRGVGGRMSTRRADWVAGDGAVQPARFDHGAPGFTARSPQFARAVEQACAQGCLQRWAPRIAPGSYVPLDGPVLWVPAPDMPALCRAWLDGITVQLGCRIDALRQDDDGWALDSDGQAVASGFDAVVVAIPPEQAAELIRPHQRDWAERARRLDMRPAWALMAVTDDEGGDIPWDAAWPATGPLAWVVRNDGKPGRDRTPGVGQWVAHATADWSQTHLEAAAPEVTAALQDALVRCVGRPLTWYHTAVHRWRYASVPRAATRADLCWWDAGSGLGVCGDAWGGAGVEGAWTSGRALAALLIDHRPGSQARGQVASPTLAPFRRFP